MLDLAVGLAEAKSRQDVDAALQLLHPAIQLEAPALGGRAQGRAENERALRWFFTVFPDYRVELAGHAAGADVLVCWGTAHLTMSGDRLGVPADGARVDLPVTIRFTFADGLIASERFDFDLATLCAGSGASTDAVRERLFGTERAA
ncbi:UNVERIFIED_CONTAM: hypothetical protein LK11_08555 [Mumia flava]